METTDTVGLILRAVVGATMLAHGYNHWRGPGGIAGTERWFGGIGLRPPRMHALASVAVELAAGAALLIGLLTPLAAAAVVGTMVVAGLTAHRGNGFFVFKDGYEYVLVLAVVSVCLSALGPGKISLDHALGTVVDGPTGAAIAGLLGLIGGLALLATCWRPNREKAAATTEGQNAHPDSTRAGDLSQGEPSRRHQPGGVRNRHYTSTRLIRGKKRW